MLICKLVLVCLVGCVFSANVTQISQDKENLKLTQDPDYIYETWKERRLHTVDLWAKNTNSDKEHLGQREWYTIKFYKEDDHQKEEEESPTRIIFNWNMSLRAAFTYINFVNTPLGPERVELRITTNFFDMENATKPLNNSLDFTKYTVHLNRTHIVLWVNDVMALKLYLRDIPKDLGDTKKFKFQNFPEGSYYRIYYWDPTVFCWTGHKCYEDELPSKFHFDREHWQQYSYTKKDLGDFCEIVNCTAEMSKSEYPRCVRLYHTPQGESSQKVLLQCTNENYTYEVCEQFPDKPCWYEVCDNYDLCNSAPSSITLSFILLLLAYVVLALTT